MQHGFKRSDISRSVDDQRWRKECLVPRGKNRREMYEEAAFLERPICSLNYSSRAASCRPLETNNWHWDHFSCKRQASIPGM